MKDRREFVKTLLVGGGMAVGGPSFASLLGPCRLEARDRQLLPAPVPHTCSPEILLNSRRSYHSFQAATVPEQTLANVLYAIGRAPIMGSSRTIYVGLPTNVYRYEPATHELILHKAGNHLSQTGAFEVAIAAELLEDAGAALHLGQVACHAFWAAAADRPSACPKDSCSSNAASSWDPVGTIQMGTCFGLSSSSDDLSDTLCAHSSDGSLPDPSTDSDAIFEEVLAELTMATDLDDVALLPSQLGQIVWAAYGCSDHNPMGAAGLTVASSWVDYYFTGGVYLVREEGVGIYHSRNGDSSTTDHRLEPISTEDRRAALASAVAGLPESAACFIVFAAIEDHRWSRIEAGFCGASGLLQATALGLPGSLSAGFDATQQESIRTALSLSASEYPLLILALSGAPTLFSDGFESGNSSKWSGSVP